MKKFIAICFVLSCLCLNAQSIIRGPYLQVGTTNSIIIRWNTDVASSSKVFYGLDSLHLLSYIQDTSKVTSHLISLSNLSADTKYYYSVGTTNQVIVGDGSYHFTTSPQVGTDKKTTIWVIGDCGNNSTNQIKVRDEYVNFMDAIETNVWLTLGDNAYNNGFDSQFQSNFFDIYREEMKSNVLWPATGNHDYDNNSSNQNTHNVPYFDIFSMPTHGEAGGIASNSEAFYSYNYSNIHFVALDSYGKEQNQFRLYDTLGPQVTWLKQDLAANHQKWTVVYWHHAPYTMGSHNSDTEAELVNIRQNLLKIVERYNVDLILCGHSHDYERSKMLHGYTGDEASFNENTHNVSHSTGRYDNSTNSCPYVKNDETNGTVYVVAGSSGQLGGNQAGYPHNAMCYSNVTYGGSLAITVEGNRLDSKWICSDGQIRDQFTIMKDVNKTKDSTVKSIQPVVLTASWNGKHNWNIQGGSVASSISVSPISDSIIVVKDDQNCLSDTFNLYFGSQLLINCNSNQTIYSTQSKVIPDLTSLIKSSTNCSGLAVHLTQLPLAGSPLTEGSNLITITATNDCGKTQTCPSIITYINNAGIEELGSTLGLNIFPNPTKSDVTFNYTIEKESLIKISITDLNGKIVATILNETVLPGDFSKKVNLQHLSKGEYSVHFQSGEISKFQKLVIE